MDGNRTVGAPPERLRASLADVAATAHCSTASVSLVLTNKHHGRISPRLAERIRLAAQEVGYQPNRAARQLATGTSDIVAAVVPDPANPFYAQLLSALAEGLGHRGQLSLVIPAADEDLSRASARAAMLDPAVIVVSSPPYGFQPPAGSPLLLVDVGGESMGPCQIDFDVRECGQLIGEHLAGLGHRRIGWFGLGRDVPSLALRRQALEETLAVHHASLVASHEFPVADPAAALAGFHELWPSWEALGVTALVCGDDLLAYGALVAAQGMGVAIPRELSVVGTGDLWYSRGTTPPLTTVNLRPSDLGRRAAKAVLSWLDDPDSTPAGTHFPVQLVVRESTAPPA